MGIDVLGTHDLRLTLHLAHCSAAFLYSQALIRASRGIGQRDLDASRRILAELECLDSLGQVEEMGLNRREIEFGPRQEPQTRRPYAGRADRALDGQRLALDLSELDRNLAADADADESDATTGPRIIEHGRQGGVVTR